MTCICVQKVVRQAKGMLIVCADGVSEEYTLLSANHKKWVSCRNWSEQQAMFFVDHFLLAASAVGLGTCFLGGKEEHAIRIMPSDAFVPVL